MEEEYGGRQRNRKKGKEGRIGRKERKRGRGKGKRKKKREK